MRLIPFLICLLWAGPVIGQWNTNIWPSSKTYFDGRKRAMQVYSSLVEKATATATSTNAIEFPGFFTQRSRLISYKSYIKDSLTTNFVYSTITNAAGNFYSSNDLTSVSMWSVTGLLADVGAPTNYFDSTPYFKLNTESNGWLFMREICDRLKWTTTDEYIYVYSQRWADVFGVSVCADALVVLTNEYATSGWFNVAIRSQTNYSVNSDSRIASGDYEAVLQRRKIKFVASNLTDQIWHEVDLLAYRPTTFYLTRSFLPTLVWGGDSAFDNLDGIGHIIREFTVDHTISASSNATVISDWLGSGAETSPFTLGGQPTCAPWGISAGTELKFPAFIVRWDVTNGFNYVAD